RLLGRHGEEPGVARPAQVARGVGRRPSGVRPEEGAGMRLADEVLREVFAERADGITPDGDVYGAVLDRRRRRRRRAVVGAGVAAAIIVGGSAAAVPAVRGADRSLPAVTPSPTADPLTACVPPV